MLETEIGQSDGRVFLDEFVVEGASCLGFVWMNEVEKGVCLEPLGVPTE